MNQQQATPNYPKFNSMPYNGGVRYYVREQLIKEVIGAHTRFYTDDAVLKTMHGMAAYFATCRCEGNA